ncbi:MAG: hypothetical protein ABSF28_09685 [Terracidiphilus sp.]|jgi:V8-like Glu-specific endopeptidase
MADTDVVKHDLKTTANAPETNWEEYTEPVPFPSGGGDLLIEPGKLNYTPPVTTRITVEELVTAPYRSVGRMGVVIGGGKKTASGWVVARRAFITAGHCVYHPDYGGWITQAGFAPRYNNGVDTAFTVASVYTLKGGSTPRIGHTTWPPAWLPRTLPPRNPLSPSMQGFCQG